ncbi:MAG: microcin C ABC transporter permease YejB [Pseudomonadota bacterium]
MFTYVLRRLALIVPTLFGILLLNFVIIQFAPGGPVEQVLAELQGQAAGATARVSGGDGGAAASATANSQYRGADGLRPDIIAEIEKQYGFDKPAYERFAIMVRDYLRFDFGESYYRDIAVVDLVIEKLPVSVSLGLWTTLLTYLISIPLGIAKAVRDGSRFDSWTSFAVVVGNAIPGFLFAVLLIVFFAGGRYWDLFPLRGLTSDNFDELSTLQQIGDYFWHLVLPVTSMVIGGFAGLTLLTKNAFLDQIRLQYVETARAKGLSDRRVLYGHVFRNAMLIVIAGFPSAFIGILFTSSLLIEVIFSLDGLGLLGFEAAIERDYPVIFATLYIFTLLALVMQLVGDLVYHWVDPRIDFEARG